MNLRRAFLTLVACTSLLGMTGCASRPSDQNPPPQPHARDLGAGAGGEKLGNPQPAPAQPPAPSIPTVQEHAP